MVKLKFWWHENYPPSLLLASSNQRAQPMKTHHWLLKHTYTYHSRCALFDFLGRFSFCNVVLLCCCAMEWADEMQTMFIFTWFFSRSSEHFNWLSCMHVRLCISQSTERLCHIICHMWQINGLNYVIYKDINHHFCDIILLKAWISRFHQIHLQIKRISQCNNIFI